MNRPSRSEGRKGQMRTNGGMSRKDGEDSTPLSDAFECVGIALTLATGALLLWLWCAGTPAQSSAEAEFEKASEVAK